MTHTRMHAHTNETQSRLFVLKKEDLGAGEMAPSVKCLPGVLAGGPELETQNPHKKGVCQRASVIPVLRGQRQEEPQSVLASLPIPSQPQVQQETLSQNTR